MCWGGGGTGAVVVVPGRWRCCEVATLGVTLLGAAMPGAGGGPARPGHPSRWRGPSRRAKYTWRCGAPSPASPQPRTFLLAGEGHQVLALAGLQRLFLQVLQQRLAIQRPRRALLRLVPLPQPRRQQHVLGRHRGGRGCGGPARCPPPHLGPGRRRTSGSISSSSMSSCSSSSADSSCRILSSSMSRYFSSSCR